MSEILTILGSVGFNWHVAIANFINFLIILFLLKHFVFSRVSRVLEERRLKIAKGIESADEAGRHLMNAHDEAKEIVKKAYGKEAKIIEEASKKAHLTADDIRAQGEKEAAIVLDQAKTHRSQVEEDVMKQFKDQAPALVASLFEKTLKQSMNKEQNDALIMLIASK